MPGDDDNEVVLEPTVELDPIPADAGGVVRGVQITVSGHAGCRRLTPGGGVDAIEAISIVEVQLGTFGDFVAARPTGPIAHGHHTWITWTTDALPIVNVVGDRLVITARVSAGEVTATSAATVTIDRTPPVLDLATPRDLTARMDRGTARFDLSGSAHDELSPVISVEGVLTPGGPFAVMATRPDWSAWNATVAVQVAGTYSASLRARDSEGNLSAAANVVLRAVEVFEPPDPNDVFGPGGYLADLLGFAQRRMVDARDEPLGPDRLTEALHQRFTALVDPSTRSAASEPVLQVRVAVEIARAAVVAFGLALPEKDESTFAEAVYVALLAEVGTSRDELRQARGDDASRTRIAMRIGVDRPDRLDTIWIPTGKVTESVLERIFGWPATTRDPFTRGARSQLLGWQLERLRATWQLQDQATRAFDDVPAPFIDPDLWAESELRSREASDPAFALWSARTAEVHALVEDIDRVRRAATSSLDGFDALANGFIADAATLTNLHHDFQAGHDVAERLRATHLEPVAFVRLMRIRDLAITNEVDEEDWADAVAIAVQTAKIARYPRWAAEEQTSGLTLAPDYFAAADPASFVPPRWRGAPRTRRDILTRLAVRTAQYGEVIAAAESLVDAVSVTVLPWLRGRLATTLGNHASELFVDLAASGELRTTRLDQAIESLQSAVLAIRLGALPGAGPTAGWRLASSYSEPLFDEDWRFFGAFEAWQGAMRAFIYPESHALPKLRPEQDGVTDAYRSLVAELRTHAVLTPQQVRRAAAAYLTQLRASFADDSAFPEVLRSPSFVLTDVRTTSELVAHQLACVSVMRDIADPHRAPSYVKEVFYFVPAVCSLELHRAGEYLATLDWLQTVYAYQLPPGPVDLPTDTLPGGQPLPDRRHIYYGLTLERGIQTRYQRPAAWPREGADPFEVIQDRAGALAQFVVTSIVRAFLAFGDAELARDTRETVARARTLYAAALDLIAVEFPGPKPGDTARPFGIDPAVTSLRLHAEASTRKIHLGLDIAGFERGRADTNVAIAPSQPTPYRFATLVARARDLVQLAGQAEAGLLAALEKADAEAYSLLRAQQDLAVQGEVVRLNDLKVDEAGRGIEVAALQRGRAEMQFDYFDDLINAGTSFWEKLQIGAELAGAAVALASGGGGGGGGSGGGGGAAGIGGIGAALGSYASIKRRDEEWRFQRNMADQDKAIGDVQITQATEHLAVAAQEQQIARLQHDHAVATLGFLANKFTGLELYEFMIDVMDRAYRYFLQRATSVARLAEDQLAFERQEPRQGVIGSDYYVGEDGTASRRGIGGSTRLLADLVELDQRALSSDRRRLQLSKTFSLAQLAPIDFARFRETGVIVFSTTQGAFDRDFPGHYLRLVKRVRTSVIALVPPTEGIHATLASSGTSRVVVETDHFVTVTVRREPETIALVSPREATGLFELAPDPQADLLLPFEGMGVDAVWRFDLPRASNFFDYSTIADVLITLDYTALSSIDYRARVIHTLDRQISADRVYSLSQTFPDRWYELHDPEASPTPMTIRFETTRSDFPPNLDELSIEQLLLYFSPAVGAPIEIPGVRLSITERDRIVAGGIADTMGGVISTRRSNGSTWLAMTNRSPTAVWELALPGDAVTRELFSRDALQDVLFVITYRARTSAWPA